MRKFKIFNVIGQEYDLNDVRNFFHGPVGLGFEMDNKFERIGNQFLLTGERIKQPEPEGQIRFKDYQAFNEFVKFLQKKPLKLQYQAADTYYLNVVAKRIEKKEMEMLGLIVSIRFSGLGLWYKDVIKNIDGTEALGKVYPYGYPYLYADGSQAIVTVDSDSEIESPIVITIMGPCTNPTYTHYVNGIPVASGKIFYDLQEGRRIQISSKVPYSIKELDDMGGELKDLYGKSDFSTERFLMMQSGTNEIAFVHDGAYELKAVVEAMIFYEAV